MGRKAILLLGFSMVFILSVLSEAHAVSVNFNILDKFITVGEIFNVEVWVDGEGIEEDLLAFGFDVATDEEFFTYDGYTIGSDFLDASDLSNPVNVAGLGAGAMGHSTLENDLLLTTLIFTATNIGTGYLDIAGIYDGWCSGLFYEFSGANIIASADIAVNPVPEPATMLLFGTGVLGLVGLGRRKRKFNSSASMCAAG